MKHLTTKMDLRLHKDFSVKRLHKDPLGCRNTSNWKGEKRQNFERKKLLKGQIIFTDFVGKKVVNWFES